MLCNLAKSRFKTVILIVFLSSCRTSDANNLSNQGQPSVTDQLTTLSGNYRVVAIDDIATDSGVIVSIETNNESIQVKTDRILSQGDLNILPQGLVFSGVVDGESITQNDGNETRRVTKSELRSGSILHDEQVATKTSASGVSTDWKVISKRIVTIEPVDGGYLLTDNHLKLQPNNELRSVKSHQIQLVSVQ